MFSTFLALTLIAGSNPGDQARERVEAWLKDVKPDARPALEAIWSSDRALVDKVADGLALGDAEIARILADARAPQAPPPHGLPALFQDQTRPAFVRANVALAYAKGLTQRRIYEESLDALQGFRPDQVVEPATFLFYKSVAEHSLLRKAEALATIQQLLDDAAQVPERYLLVAQLMRLDLEQWRERDLGSVARVMNNVERRLELARGGPRTQEMQRDVVARLDELIRRLERPEPPTPPDDGDGPQAPRPRDASVPRLPQDETRPGDERGPGDAAIKRFKDLVEPWGKLNEIERVKIMTELIRDLPPGSRQMVEDYFRKLAQAAGGSNR